MSVLFPNFWDIRYKKKKEPAPIKNLLTWFVRQRPVSERDDYNNKRLSRTGKANNPTPNSGFRERTGSYHYLKVPSSKRESDEQLRAKGESENHAVAVLRT